MGLNFKDAALHVKMRKGHHLLTNGGSGKFECARCHRWLEDHAFKIVADNSRRDILYLHQLCNTCRKQKASLFGSHPLITPKAHRFIHQLVQRTRLGAEKRNIVFGLDEDDVLHQFIAQNGKCAMTGRTMTLDKGVTNLSERHALSIDRIDSAGNYTTDNIHLVCRMINYMKSELTVEEFGEWCSAVLMHSLRQAESS